MVIDIDLFNELLKVAIGLGIFLIVSCLVYIVKNILIGLFYLDDVSEKAHKQEIKKIVKEELKKKD